MGTRDFIFNNPLAIGLYLLHNVHLKLASPVWGQEPRVPSRKRVPFMKTKQRLI